MNDDPKEVLSLLNSMGFVGITAQQLKGFMKDLKLYRKVKEREKQQRREEITKKIIDKQQSDIKKILREQRKQFCSAENIVSTESSNSYVDNPIVKVKVQCLSNEKENTEPLNSEESHSGTQKKLDVRKPKSKISSDHYSVKPTSVSYDNESANICLKSSKKCPECLKQDAYDTKKHKTKADNDKFVHHVESASLQPHRPMSAPNILEQEQERVGSSQTKSILSTKTSQSGRKSFPGEAKHASLRWAIREKMLGGDPHPMPVPRKSVSMPTLKKK
ncbi:PREDICTED: uncharacterized protein LOC107187146 [Dufourea novaeangliae]|uniref:uncharacterized protein LOC107187146 n=1 Tax=Dufourea novaeangliae TaxID=178035 RepID=UPI000767841F|nr:PREDICTED: uncharacterized protein LOC107187146 [Dufourea novaeangliae]